MEEKVMNHSKYITVDVEKGLIIECFENAEKIHLTIRKAKEGEKQEDVAGHCGYKCGNFIRYIFDFFLHKR